MLNTHLFQEIHQHKRKILVVTKYWDTEMTHKILTETQKSFPQEYIGVGENRVESLKQKKLPREITHFIGNIQSRKIHQIVEHCFTIHSLCSIKHAQKIESLEIPTEAFVQIHLDTHKNIGIPADQLINFLNICKDFRFLKIIGISGMGRSEANEKEKTKEFQQLCILRDNHIPHGKISAGTSRDYKIALGLGIDIVRVGKKALQL